MKTRFTHHLMATLLCVAFTAELHAQSSAFTYQGQFADNGTPATGLYDFEFTLYDSSGGLTAVGGPVTNSPIEASNGLFTATLNFGAGVFDGSERWLEIGVRTNGGGAFTALSPRQLISATPYALRALNLSADGLSGGSYSNVVNFVNPANEFVGIHIGDGSGLSGIHSLDAADGFPTHALFVDDIGNVGIGTTSPYAGVGLTLRGVGANSGWLQFRTSGGVDEWHLTYEGGGLNFVESGVTANRLVLKPGGNIGIGTPLPQGRLHVAGPTVIQGLVTPPAASSTNLLNLGSGVTSDGFRNGISFFETASTTAMSLGYDGTGNSAENALRVYHSSGNPLFTFEASGELGIGTNKPIAPLHVTGVIRSDTQVSVGGTAQIRATESGTDGADLWLRDAMGQVTVDLDAEGGGGGSTLSMANGNGVTTVSIDADQTDAAYMALRKADGSDGIVLDADNGIGGSLVAAQIMRITGGADVAEPFQINGDGLQPGMVVSIDPSQPGQLALSQTACDRKVAGIISGAGGVRTGLMLGQEGSVASGKYPVALTGRVYCWCDATSGKIEPGDLLTSSDVPGHAMKVTEMGRAQGAILGKAMSSLEEGRGLVLVLVNLH